MVRPNKTWQGLLCFAVLLVGGTAWAGEEGQALLDKATDVKLSAENLADLNQVIKLCQDALKAGLDEDNTKFANVLMASTLTQRAEIVCLELFEHPVPPNQARQLVQMAQADLEQTLQLDAEQPQAQYLIGRLYALLGETEKGIKALDEAIRLSENDSQARAKALMIRANLKTDPDQRQADFDAAAKLMPHDANVLRFRGMFHLTQNHLESAIADFNAAKELEPEDPDTYEALGIAYSLLQKYDEAMESLNKAIELDPESPAAFTHRARVRAIKGDLPASLVDVEQALKLQPDSMQALLLRASLLSTSGKYEQALTDLNVLRQALPDQTEILLQIGALYQVTKQPQKAIAAYEHAIEVEPKNVAAYRSRADVYLSLGKQPEAIADYEKAIEIDPKNSGALNNLAWVLATSPEDNLRNGKRAIELATLACEVTEHKQAYILSTLAASYAETGDFDTAITWSQKAVELGEDELKGQLAKELESYQQHKPWREANPPADAAAQAAKPETTSR